MTPANILPSVLIPIFGPMAAITAELTNHLVKNDAEALSKEFQALGEDTYWKTLRQPETVENIVPLEEALIINDRVTRKQLVFETLLEDPLKNIDILLVARENNDADTAHYANTTIAKIQRDFQLQIQKMAVEFEKDPDNRDLLEKYIDVLNNFINSGLSEAFLLRKQRITLAELLERKLELSEFDKKTLDQKIDNCIELGEINEATKAVQFLMREVPDDEQTWINEIRICVASRDSIRLKNSLGEMKLRKIAWTAEGKDKVALWMGTSP